MFFRKKKPETVLLRPGEKAPDFQLPSVQGGMFRMELRTAHGPVALVFVDTGEEGLRLLAELQEREGEFRRAGAYNYAYPNPEIREGRVPSTRSGTTVAAVVRATSMEPVRELLKHLKLPYYVLWDAEGRVSTAYGIEGEIAAVVVEQGGKIAWASPRETTPDVEEILEAIQATVPEPSPVPQTHATAAE